MIRRLGLFCLCLMYCLYAVPLTNAQSPSDDWEIPQIECGEDCRRSEVVDEAGNLYILVNQYEPLEIMLYVIERGSSKITEYNMLQFYSPHELGIRTHLVPFAIGKIVIFSYQSEVPLTFLDLRANTVIPLEVEMPGRMQECDIYSNLVSTPSIFRIGTERVLFCSRAEDISYLNVARLEDDTLVLEHSIEVGGSATPERYTPPWRYLTSSLDGKVYVVFFPDAPILDRIAPQYADLTDFSTYLVLRFDPLTGVWDTIIIDTSSERWQKTEGSSAIAPFVGVDEIGNLYFWHYSYTLDEIRRSDLVKYDPQGEKVWHRTEADFGGKLFFFPVLVAEDRFIFDSLDRILRYIVWEEN